jgi:hypothetical protein
MENAKDVVVAVLGASVSLAGLLLVFAGLLFGQSAAFPPDTTDDAVILRFKNAGRYAIWPFLFSLLLAAVCLSWLLSPGDIRFHIAWVGFFFLVVATAIYGYWVSTSLL